MVVSQMPKCLQKSKYRHLYPDEVPKCLMKSKLLTSDLKKLPMMYTSQPSVLNGIRMYVLLLRTHVLY